MQSLSVGNTVIKPGDLVKYMSRIVLVVEIDDEWVHGIELGENTVGKYSHKVVKGFNQKLKKNEWSK